MEYKYFPLTLGFYDLKNGKSIPKDIELEIYSYLGNFRDADIECTRREVLQSLLSDIVKCYTALVDRYYTKIISIKTNRISRMTFLYNMNRYDEITKLNKKCTNQIKYYESKLRQTIMKRGKAREMLVDIQLR